MTGLPFVFLYIKILISETTVIFYSLIFLGTYTKFAIMLTLLQNASFPFTTTIYSECPLKLTKKLNPLLIMTNTLSIKLTNTKPTSPPFTVTLPQVPLSSPPLITSHLLISRICYSPLTHRPLTPLCPPLQASAILPAPTPHNTTLWVAAIQPPSLAHTTAGVPTYPTYPIQTHGSLKMTCLSYSTTLYPLLSFLCPFLLLLWHSHLSTLMASGPPPLSPPSWLISLPGLMRRSLNNSLSPSNL